MPASETESLAAANLVQAHIAVAGGGYCHTTQEARAEIAALFEHYLALVQKGTNHLSPPIC